MSWDHTYRRLEEGEIILETDEVQRNYPLRWEAPHPAIVGTTAPNPNYTSHRVYRRVKDAPKPEHGYLIRKYGGYYRPDSAGYTREVADAGRYSLDDAIKITHPNGPDGPRDGMSYVHESEVMEKPVETPMKMPVAKQTAPWVKLLISTGEMLIPVLALVLFGYVLLNHFKANFTITDYTGWTHECEIRGGVVYKGLCLDPSALIDMEGYTP